MARSIPARINPDMLVWARETARVSLADAAQRLDVAEADLGAWEEGEPGLTVAKLQKIAETYRRPLAAFFLSARPDVPEHVRDFRRLPDTVESWGPNLASEIRRAEQQREAVIELLDLRNEPARSSWQEPASAPREELPERARSLLATKSLAGRPTVSSRPTDWFFFWSSALEEIGVLVVTMNRVDPKEARGFSLTEDQVPVVAVNGSEHFNGRIFTLLHEYAHLLLSTSGLCDLHETRPGTRDQDTIEVECNRLAGEMLVPSSSFTRRSIYGHSDATQNDWPLQLLIDEGRFWGVSPEVVLRKLVDTGRASRHFYQHWRESTSQRDQEETFSVRTTQKSGGDGLRTKVRNLGKGYVRLVVGTHNEGLLSTYETANLLSSKTDAIPKLLARAGAAESD
jgi:Zn-dependent peptidase ImmA (M78 family)/transcriptional regulator with XRE-family HTH domain